MASTQTKRKTFKKEQWIAATEVFLLVVTMGANWGWISPFLGKLSRPDPPFETTKEQTTWVASIVSISRPIGTVTGTITTNYLGSKRSMLVCGLYYIFAWLSLIVANSINIVYVNLFFCGLGMGVLQTTYPLYFGEIVDPAIRGTIISFVMHGYMIGVLCGNLMGAHMEPWAFAAVNMVITVIYLVTFFFLPATPHHLINVNKLEEAEKSMTYYSGGENSKQELIKLQEFLNTSPPISFLESVKRLKEPVNLKTLIMINILYSLVQFSGIYALLEYMEIIFSDGKVEIVLPSTLVTIMSAVTIPGCWMAMATSDKFGRVTMLLFSCIIFCIAFVGWGLNFQLLDLGYDPSKIQWLMIVFSLIYRVSMTVGLTPIVPVLMSEIFAPNVKIVSCGISNVLSSLCVFISSKNFQYMVDAMTYQYLFYFFATLIAIVGIYTKFCVPETKGKTLPEIQAMLLKKSSPSSNESNLSQVYVNTVCEQTNNDTKL